MCSSRIDWSASWRSFVIFWPNVCVRKSLARATELLAVTAIGWYLGGSPLNGARQQEFLNGEFLYISRAGLFERQEARLQELLARKEWKGGV